MQPANEHTDLELLQLLRSDDDFAFTAIYQRYWERLFTAACRKLASPHEAEEIVQDIFLDLWRRRDSIAINGDLEAYLAVAVKYRVINFLASRNRKKRLFASAPDAVAHNDADTAWLEYSELEKQLADTIERLPEKCRLVFLLSRAKGMNHKQIATRMGIAEKTVESHMTRALRSLRSALQSLVSFFF
jgi:RNA polymerase sigma-70 factor (family 1)